jgi:uncharacterized iron-regulated membrane protein
MSLSVDGVPERTALSEASASISYSGWKLRKLLLNVHLCLTLAVGFLFVVLGVTGSCNTFYLDLDEFLNPEMVVTHPQETYRSLDDIFQSVQATHPKRTGAWNLALPRHQAGMLTAWYPKPEEKANEFSAPLMVSVNPYTAEVIKSRFWGETLFTFIYEIHADLWLGEWGFKTVGILGLALLTLLLTGLYLWWPKGGKWRQAFTLKRTESTEPLSLMFTSSLASTG